MTQALFRPNVSHDYDNGLADLLDVVGQNYRENEILAAHQQKPTRKILGTENTHDRRGWLALRDNPAYAGQFLWAGIDYLGEGAHLALHHQRLLRPARSHRHDQADGLGAAELVERTSRWSTYRARVGARSARRPIRVTRRLAAAVQTLFDDWSSANRERARRERRGV